MHSHRLEGWLSHITQAASAKDCSTHTGWFATAYESSPKVFDTSELCRYLHSCVLNYVQINTHNIIKLILKKINKWKLFHQAQAFNPSNLKAEAGRFLLNSKLVQSTKQVPGSLNKTLGGGDAQLPWDKLIT